MDPMRFGSPQQFSSPDSSFIPSESSAIASVGCGDASTALDVTFKGGALYRYFGVPRPVYDAFVAAKSKGTFLNQCIKGRFPYSRLRSPRRAV
jgi:hypothetical protein